MKPRISRSESQKLTRNKILDAAEEEFAKLGFAAASVDRLTEKAGFSRGAFYSNFDSKEELFLALVEDRMQKIINDLQFLIEKSVQLPADAVFKYYIERAFDKELTLIMAEFLIAGIRHSSLRAKISELNSLYIEKVASALAAALETRGKQTAKRQAMTLLAAGQGLMLFHFLNTEINPEKLIEQCMKDLFQSME